MAQVYKCLGQVAPLATTETTLYTVPASTEGVGSTLCVCNRSTATTFRVSVALAGVVTATKQYLAYDAPIAANDSIFLTLGLTLAETDVVRVYAGTANLSFSLFGLENA